VLVFFFVVVRYGDPPRGVRCGLHCHHLLGGAETFSCKSYFALTVVECMYVVLTDEMYVVYIYTYIHTHYSFISLT
jgi:hypothetical protein